MGANGEHRIRKGGFWFQGTNGWGAFTCANVYGEKRLAQRVAARVGGEVVSGDEIYGAHREGGERG